MRVNHYKILVCGGDSFKAIKEMIDELSFEAGMERGFVKRDVTKDAFNNVNRTVGRYIYKAIGLRKQVNPATLESESIDYDYFTDLVFELDQTKGLAMVEDKRGDFEPLYEALESMPQVHVSLEDLNLNLKDMLFELQGAYKKNTVKAFRLKDYLARENMLASASFKILEDQDAEKIAEKFDDQLDAFQLALKLPDGLINVTITRKGSVKVSDDCPDEVLMFVKDLIPQFHEAEIETTEVHSPVKGK